MNRSLRTVADVPRPRKKEKFDIYSKPVYVVVVVCLTILAISIISDFILNFDSHTADRHEPEIVENFNLFHSPQVDVEEGVGEAAVGMKPPLPHVVKPKPFTQTKKSFTKTRRSKNHTVSILYYKPYSSLLSRAEKIAHEITLRNKYTKVVLTPYTRWLDINELNEQEKNIDCFLGIGVSGQLLMQKLNKVVVTREPSCVEEDTNYFGENLASILTSDIAKCKKACAGFENCAFWSTHPVDKTDKNTEYYCDLKDNKDDPKFGDGYISGPRECPHSIYQKLDNKHEMVDFEFVPKGSALNIPQIPTHYVTNETAEADIQEFMNEFQYEKYILKQENGAGANNIIIVKTAKEATKVEYGHGGFYVMQPFIWPHKQLSMNIMAYEGKVEGMLLADCDGGQNPEIMVKLGYMCILVPDDAWFAPKIKAFIKEFVAHNHISGMMGVDFMLAGQDLYLMEVNPRVTGMEALIDKRGASVYWDRILSRYFEHCGIPMKKHGAPYQFYQVKEEDTGKYVNKLYATPWWYYYIKAMTKDAYLPKLQELMNEFVSDRSDAVLEKIFAFEPQVLNALENICFECKLVMDFLLNRRDSPPKMNIPHGALDLNGDEEAF